MGTVSFSNVTMAFPDGSSPTLAGSLPGTLTATLNGLAVATLTRSLDGVVTSSGPPGCWARRFDSGTVVNADGKTFSLFLLEPTPEGTFANDEASRQIYADLCADCDQW